MDTIDPEGFENRPVDVNALPKFEEVPLKPLERGYLIKRYLSTGLLLLVFLVFSGGVYFSAPEEYSVFLPLLLLLFSIITLWRFITDFQVYRRSAYGLRERDILYKRGFLVEKMTVVPFNRIQHVSTKRNVLDKLLGIATLQVFTAGGMGSDLAIPGLIPGTAEALKQRLAEEMGRDGH